MRHSSSTPHLLPEHLEPSLIEGHQMWRGTRRGARFLFVGRSWTGRREDSGPLRVPALAQLRVAHLRQVHGVRLVDATAGPCGEGDALQTNELDLALCIQTADCVPVLLVGESRVVAIHAGWRGIAAGIIGSTVDALGDGQAYQAIIGPAIGPCCYEVDGDVADAVEAALPSPRAIDRRSRSKPHLDLQLAVVEQLSRHGAKTTEWVRTCTRCSKDLWSYRRDGPGKGRNLAFVWLDSEPLA